MTQRIAPNNQLPATQFIEVWETPERTEQDGSPHEMWVLSYSLALNDDYMQTIAIFRIRENKLPTKHNFSK